MGGEIEFTDTPAALVGLRDDGLVEFRYKRGAVVDIDAARSLVGAAKELMGDRQPCGGLVIVGDVKKVTRDARQFFSQSEENQQVSTHVALVVTSPIARMIGNFMMGLNKPVIPTRMFTDQGQAVAWLKESESS